MEKRKIADLHCDLLVYLLGEKGRSAHDPICRCAIPQLQAGNVHLQIMPAYVTTNPHSSKEGMSQVKIFEQLPELYPDTFKIIRQQSEISRNDGLIGILLAFENAAGFCSEEEPLDKAWERLLDIEKRNLKVAYISMTWNEENRFGGGAHTEVGLKPDGEQLLQFMDKRKIAIDLSHASDLLAEQILNYITKKNLDIPVIASHSNFRSVTDALRNLPDFIAKEIIYRRGIIGMNFVRYFVGDDPARDFINHLEHGLNLKAQDQLCLGADFFYVGDIPILLQKNQEGYFFSNISDASCYPQVIDIWKNSSLISDPILDQITHSNLQQFLQTQIFS
jgi:membrane dipeptidase